MTLPSLYRRILGARFDELPESLRRFHDASEGGRDRGTFRITRGPGWLRHTLPSLMGLPRAGSDVPIQLSVKIEGDREPWIRDFAGHHVETVQEARGDVVMKSQGLASLSSALVIEGSRL